MEDSYTVHRRRKAAARRREKTPEPSSRSQRVESSEDEEGARRARMEKMAEDTERMELQLGMENERTPQESQTDVAENDKGEGRASREKETQNTQQDGGGEAGSSLNAGDSEKLKIEDARVSRRSSRELSPRPREPDAEEKSANARSTRTTSESNKEDEPIAKRDARKAAKGESVAENARVNEVRKAERRTKKRSKERLKERHSRSTDSSDAEEKSEANLRRTKSPDGKVRAKKSSSRSRAAGATVDAEKSSQERRQKPMDDASDRSKEMAERKPASARTDTDEEPKTMKKSETFPRGSAEEPVMKRSATDTKKQIIPLSNDSLIEDFAKAQRQYLRERSILEPDPMDVFQDASEETTLRRRKVDSTRAEGEREDASEAAGSKVKDEPEKKTRGWFSWVPFLGGKKEKIAEKKDEDEHEIDEARKPAEKMEVVVKERELDSEKVTLMDFLRALKDVVAEFRAFVSQNPAELRIIAMLRNRCAAELILMAIYCGLGAFVFRFTEGAFESFYKCGVKRVKRDFLDSLWNYSHNLREDDWKSMARKKLMEFEEQLHSAHEAGVHTYSGQRSWSFLNAVVYCLTVITTIGYGHISPSTTTGRAITIVYAIFGIPMFLIILADFGKLFTRGIKFLWAFVRRLYYTGSCRKVRGTAPVQEVMKGVQLVYDLATFRRPSQMNPEDIEEMQRQAQQPQTVLNLDGNVPDTPGTPAMSTFAIDDEFNLPISVAIFILLGYIFVGATLFYLWEDWGFFESFYFVFISMSTIGFGDYVPKHPMYMMCSIVYLMFGLALTSMCINVVQVMLSDSFKQASQKIGATIGFEIAEDDGSVKPSVPPPVEVADVHATLKESGSGEKIAPKAKQEDVDL